MLSLNHSFDNAPSAGFVINALLRVVTLDALIALDSASILALLTSLPLFFQEISRPK